MRQNRRWLRRLRNAATPKKMPQHRVHTSAPKVTQGVTQPLRSPSAPIPERVAHHFAGTGATSSGMPPAHSKCVQLPPEPLHEPSTVTRPRHGPTKVVLRCVKFVWLRHHENAATGNLICRNPGPKFASSRCVCPFSVVAVTRAAHRPASFAAPALRLG